MIRAEPAPASSSFPPPALSASSPTSSHRRPPCELSALSSKLASLQYHGGRHVRPAERGRRLRRLFGAMLLLRCPMLPCNACVTVLARRRPPATWPDHVPVVYTLVAASIPMLHHLSWLFAWCSRPRLSLQPRMWWFDCFTVVLDHSVPRGAESRLGALLDETF